MVLKRIEVDPQGRLGPHEPMRACLLWLVAPHLGEIATDAPRPITPDAHQRGRRHKQDGREQCDLADTDANHL